MTDRETLSIIFEDVRETRDAVREMRLQLADVVGNHIRLESRVDALEQCASKRSDWRTWAVRSIAIALLGAALGIGATKINACTTAHAQGMVVR